MSKLKEFYQSFSFIITFMFLSVLISAMFGEKFLNKFLILILTSQLLVNVDEAKALINKFSNPIQTTKKQTNNNNSKMFSGDVKNGTLVTNQKIIL